MKLSAPLFQLKRRAKLMARSADIGVTQRMLTRTLRQLERDGLVTRHDLVEILPCVEYKLTELGMGLLIRMIPLWTWVVENSDQFESRVRTTIRDCTKNRHGNLFDGAMERGLEIAARSAFSRVLAYGESFGLVAVTAASRQHRTLRLSQNSLFCDEAKVRKTSVPANVLQASHQERALIYTLLDCAVGMLHAFAPSVKYVGPGGETRRHVVTHCLVLKTRHAAQASGAAFAQADRFWPTAQCFAPMADMASLVGEHLSEMLPSPFHLFRCRTAEMSFEVTAELRWTGIANRKGDFSDGAILSRQQNPRLMKAHRFHILYRTASRQRLEMRMIGRDAHACIAG